jgi:cytochrome c biogenesis protein ResB
VAQRNHKEDTDLHKVEHTLSHSHNSNNWLLVARSELKILNKEHRSTNDEIKHFHTNHTHPAAGGQWLAAISRILNKEHRSTNVEVNTPLSHSHTSDSSQLVARS